MEERGYIAEALFTRLRECGVAFHLPGGIERYPEQAPQEVELTIAAEHVCDVPRLLARFAQDFDLRLVELERPQRGEWRALLAWPDESARPRFLALRFLVPPDAGSGKGVGALFRRLGLRWLEKGPDGFFSRRPLVLFSGRDCPQRSHVMVHVQGSLAPLGLRMLEQHPGETRRGDYRVVYEGAERTEERGDVLLLGRQETLASLVAATTVALLRWMECRVERRYAQAVVGGNPLLARALQHPFWGGLAGLLLNSRIACRVRSPLLMPHPSGIFIDEGVQLGSRVTVMHHVTIGRKEWGGEDARGGGMPVIEDNVFIGPGAKVLGAVRVGRGARVGANAVVTRDVPSHCTVVDSNRILGAGEADVAGSRQDAGETVANM